MANSDHRGWMFRVSAASGGGEDSDAKDGAATPAGEQPSTTSADPVASDPVRAGASEAQGGELESPLTELESPLIKLEDLLTAKPAEADGAGSEPVATGAAEPGRPAAAVAAAADSETSSGQAVSPELAPETSISAPNPFASSPAPFLARPAQPRPSEASTGPAIKQPVEPSLETQSEPPGSPFFELASPPSPDESDPELEPLDPSELLDMIDNRPTSGDGPKLAPRKDEGVTDESASVRQVIETRSEQMTLRGLARRGIKNVRVLDMSVMQSIMTEAVENCMKRHGEWLSADARAQLEKESKQEFYELLAEHKKVVAEKSEIEKARDQLRGQVSGLRGDLDTQMKKLEVENQRHENIAVAQFSAESFDKMEDFIKHSFKRLLSQEARSFILEHGAVGTESFEGFEVDFSAKLHDLIARERERVIGQEDQAHRLRVQVLEARIRKLNSALTNTEGVLRKVAAMKQVDGGVASIYDSIQGLSLQDSHYGKKSALLKVVFVENMELQGFDLTDEDRDLEVLTPPKRDDDPGLEAPSGFVAPLEPLTSETAF
jgi:hypothetical protein